MNNTTISIGTSTLKYKGADGLDITRKSAVAPAIVLAPNWNMVGGVLRHMLEVNGHAPKAWMMQHPAITPEEKGRGAGRSALPEPVRL